MQEMLLIMEFRCNVLSCVSILYVIFAGFIKKYFASHSYSAYANGVLVLQCIFVMIFTRNVNSLSFKNKYRPNVSPNLMCVLLVPICIFSEEITSHGLGYQDLQLSLVTSAVIITKYFFVVKIYKIYASILLTLCLLQMALFTNFYMLIISGFLVIIVWRSLDLIPEMTPGSFSFGEMSVCLQLGLTLAGRILREFVKMEGLEQDLVRLKWIACTAVIAIIVATVVCWLMKSYKSLISFLAVHAVFAVLALTFLTLMFNDNLVIWFWQLVQNDCGVIMLLVSWILFLGITVLWTIGRAIQFSQPEYKSIESQQNDYQRKDMNTNRFVSVKQRLTALEKENPYTIGDCYREKNDDEKISKSAITLDTRKVFHLLILFVYVPGLIIAPHILLLASCLAFGVFIIVEAARVFQLTGVGIHLDQTMRAFIDERDKGTIFLTHFYLLLGLSLPIWLTYSSLQGMSSPIKLYSGVLSLGIGDTVACVAGRAFGKIKWKGSIKTVEGTLSSIFAQLGFVYFCTYFDVLPIHNHVAVILGVVHGALYEAFTDQIDNLVLPLALYPFLCLS